MCHNDFMIADVSMCGVVSESVKLNIIIHVTNYTFVWLAFFCLMACQL